MIYAGYLNVALRKPQTGQVKFKISLDTEQAKFSLLKGKKSTQWVGFHWLCYGGVYILLMHDY